MIVLKVPAGFILKHTILFPFYFNFNFAVINTPAPYNFILPKPIPLTGIFICGSAVMESLLVTFCSMPADKLMDEK